MQYRIIINCTNAAFADGNLHLEVARILRLLADDVQHRDGVVDRALLDENGNNVGGASTTLKGLRALTVK